MTTMTTTIKAAHEEWFSAVAGAQQNYIQKLQTPRASRIDT